MRNQIVVIGGGVHAKAIINVLKKLNEYDILGYTDKIDKGPVLGVKYLGNDEVLNKIIKTHKKCKAVIGVGNITISDVRRKIYERVKEIGFDLPVIKSNNAIINEDVLIGEGTVVLAGGIINSGSTIGKCVIINTGAIIEHDCHIGDFVHLATGAITGGGVEIGTNTIIGIGAKVIQYKKVNADCIIGPGAITIKDILEPGSYFGIPAKKINPKI